MILHNLHWMKRWERWTDAGLWHLLYLLPVLLLLVGKMLVYGLASPFALLGWISEQLLGLAGFRREEPSESDEQLGIGA